MTTTPDPHAEPPEGNLGDLTDDAYFDALDAFPGAVDAAGNPIEGLFDDVIDARPEKAAAVEQQDDRA